LLKTTVYNWERDGVMRICTNNCFLERCARKNVKLESDSKEKEQKRRRNQKKESLRTGESVERYLRMLARERQRSGSKSSNRVKNLFLKIVERRMSRKKEEGSAKKRAKEREKKRHPKPSGNLGEVGRYGKRD